MGVTQRWHLECAGRAHVVEVDDAGLGRRLVWRIDDEVVASTRSGDERVQLVPEPEGRSDVGAVGLRFGAFGPARRVTWYAADRREEALAAALLGVGGVDFVPEPGSKAAARQEWARAHPWRFTAQRTAAAVAGVLGALLVTWLLARLAVRVPLPDWNLPRLPWPDLPGIPWPDVPWPDLRLPGWAVPAWVREAAEWAKFVLPVLVAFAAARGELRRRRRHEQERLAAQERAGSTQSSLPDGSS